ncbi:MAG: alpha-amylase family glycosyl hydrolase [Candidatus Kapabacteria bacterium]|nr:alpha-amylase family glycosyl hydrolase [Candidatus Kapabacteria bacterium]
MIATFLPSAAQPSESELDGYFSSKPLGYTLGEQSTTFRLFAPRASSVSIVFFNKPEDAQGRSVPMTKNADGTWEHTEQKPASALVGTCYAYRVAGGNGFSGEAFDATALFADPYSRAVATKNTYRHESRTVILDPKDDEQYDWKGDTYVIPANHNTLTIYEAHVRDLTAHRSSSVKEKGSYKGLTEQGKTGGLRYLKDLGITAIEFLPLHEFANIELPYRDSSTIAKFKVFNDGNPQERNHWGYMTSFYFAPESYYASGGSLVGNGRSAVNWSGVDGRAVRELKDLVRALHKEKIAVIMDVVYNHVSDFDANPFKYIDKYYYFRTDAEGKYINTSYCGNDFKTERKMARRLIVESVKYWMTAYHIDGFRFDLATMIDRETCEEILREARKINPNVILIAEPWGGNKYGPDKFSDIGWAAWNDQIRNGVKGQNPKDGLGFIFGKHQGGNTKRSEQAFINGTLREDGGLFLQKEHSVNYLESHDDETMGDFIRLALGDCTMNTVITNLSKHAKLTPRQLALNKLAAMFLFTAQGPLMIHSGQEYARSKVIAGGNPNEQRVGMIDRNSYNKDDATNYINYQHALANKDLLNYYKGLIALRRVFPNAFGSATKQDIDFLETSNDHAIAFRIRNNSAVKGQPKTFVVVLNGNATALDISLPEGAWNVLGNAEKISPVMPLGVQSDKIVVPASSGVILAQ